jgi:hypothetical protein
VIHEISKKTSPQISTDDWVSVKRAQRYHELADEEPDPKKAALFRELAGAVLSGALRPGGVQLSTGAWFDPNDPTADKLARRRIRRQLASAAVYPAPETSNSPRTIGDF